MITIVFLGVIAIAVFSLVYGLVTEGGGRSRRPSSGPWRNSNQTYTDPTVYGDTNAPNPSENRHHHDGGSGGGHHHGGGDFGGGHHGGFGGGDFGGGHHG